MLCRCLDVTPSGFYAWRQRPESPRAQEDRRLKVLIAASFQGSRRTYGSPRVHDDLREADERVSRKRIIRLMQADGLKARVRKRYKVTTDSDHDQPIADNLLQQTFTAERPNQRWVSDTTQLVIGESGKLYLAVVLDLFSRFVVGWAVSAVQRSAPDHQSARDGGEAAVSRGGAVASLRPGLDVRQRGLSGRTQGARHRLQHEPARPLLRQRRHGSVLLDGKSEIGEWFESHGDAKARLLDYLEVFYNQQRRHSSAGRMSPAAYERKLTYAA